MPTKPNIKVEDDASLAVLMLANWLRLALPGAAGARLVTGTFAVTSTRGQAVTISMSRHSGQAVISLASGISDAARLLFHLDFNNLGDPDYKPLIDNQCQGKMCGRVGNSVRAWLRHPWLMRQARQLLALPFPPWQEGAARFWAAAATLPDMPRSLLVTCSDEEQCLTLSEGKPDAGEPDAEIVGKPLPLARLFAGHTVITRAVYTGKLRSRASAQHLAGLSNAGLELMLGGVTSEDEP